MTHFSNSSIGIGTFFYKENSCGSMFETDLGLTTHYQVLTPLGYWTQYSLPGAYTTGLLDTTHQLGDYTTGLSNSLFVSQVLTPLDYQNLYSAVRWLHHWAIRLTTDQLGAYITRLSDSLHISQVLTPLGYWAIGLTTDQLGAYITRLSDSLLISQVLTPLGYWAIRLTTDQLGAYITGLWMHPVCICHTKKYLVT